MAKESFQLDPNAMVYSDDEIVGKVNSATANINRAGSVEAAARPIEGGEIGTTELADGAVESVKLDVGVAKDNLDGMGDTERGYIKTDPQSGEKPIIAMQRQADGKLDIDNDDQPIP